jgi:hypothetical protein
MKKASTRILCAVILGSVGLGCHSESKDSSAANAEQPVATGSAKPQDKLARALASAIEPGKADQAPQASDSAPPADGVLDPSKADAVAPAHAPPKLNLGSTGSEPRVKLVHRALTGPIRTNLQISVDLGNGQGIPPVDFKLELKSGGAAAGTAGAQNVTARVISADISMPNVPEEFKAQLRKLKGARFSMKVAGDGGAFDCAQEKGSSKNPELGELLDMVAESILDAYVAVPNESVGAGAYWMTTSRQQMFGMDWITYDMVKVDQVNQGGVKLDISTRRYVVGREMPAAGQNGAPPTKLTIREAMATGSSQAMALVTSSVLSSYERSHSLRILMDAADGSGQRMLQAGGQAKFAVEH